MRTSDQPRVGVVGAASSAALLLFAMGAMRSRFRRVIAAGMAKAYDMAGDVLEAAGGKRYVADKPSRAVRRRKLRKALSRKDWSVRQAILAEAKGGQL